MDVLRECVENLRGQGHFLLINILCFLALTPAGICLTELSVIGAEMLELTSPGNKENSETVENCVKMLKDVVQGEASQHGTVQSDLMSVLSYEQPVKLEDEVKIKMKTAMMAGVLNHLK